MLLAVCVVFVHAVPVRRDSCNGAATKHEVYVVPCPKRTRTYARALPGHVCVYMHSDTATRMRCPCRAPCLPCDVPGARAAENGHRIHRHPPCMYVYIWPYGWYYIYMACVRGWWPYKFWFLCACIYKCNVRTFIHIRGCISVYRPSDPLRRHVVRSCHP